MTDADVDGAHIRTLLLTLFFRYFRPIIEHGYLYIAQPPLYQIRAGATTQYAYTEAERLEIIKDIQEEKTGKKTKTKKGKKKEEEIAPDALKGITIQRYKGLGEMNPEQLWETTMNPENRILLKVKLEDTVQTDKIFDILMGEEVLPRKKFIESRAKSVKNLDI